jgi:hypothetical protein
MRWEEILLDLFEDLEQKAEGLHLAERDAELADRSRAEYAAHVDFASRVHASVGTPLALTVTGLGVLDGTLRSAGLDWCLLETSAEQEWVVRLAAVGEARGASDRALSEPARPVVARLALGSALRRLADARSTTVIHGLDGSQSRGLIGRVGVDFLELRTGCPARVALLPFGRIAAVHRA